MATFMVRVKTSTLALALVLGCGDDDGRESGASPATGVDGSVAAGDASTPVADAAAQSTPDAGTSMGASGDGGPTAMGGPLPADALLPIVFVHGFVGSAQQYESQALRFAMNGFPLERIRAFEHHGTSTDTASFVTGADAFIDAVMKEFNTTKVYLVGHSRGTIVSTSYLSDATRAAKVAKYIALDGAACPMGPVPCLAPNQSNLPGQKHVEVSTSAASFERQFEFLFGKKPATSTIVAQGPTAKISGRVVNFPENTGRTGSLELWELVAATGARAGAQPIARFTVGESGDFGPVEVATDKHYEFVMSSPETPTQHHFYMQRFLRDSPFVRLLSGGANTPTRMNTNVSADHVAVTVSRQREWTADDKLEISTTTPSGSQPAVNVMSMPMFRMSIGIHLHDDVATPKMTTLAGLPYFNSQPFQAGVDVYMPAADPPSGTVTIRATPRGYADKPQVLTLPNWISSSHTSSVLFADYPQ